jgi:hypothetical protein
MPRKVVAKQNFLGGEAGPLLEARSDLAQHTLGLRRARNFIVLPGGAATRRPGTRYVKETQGNKFATLIPFACSYDSAADIFVVEVAAASSTSLTFRCIRVSDNSVITPTGSPITVDASIFLPEIQYTQIGETLFITSNAFEPYVLRRTSTAAFSLDAYIGLASVSSRAAHYSIPYRDTNISSTTLTPSATTGNITVTASAAFFNSGHVGTYFRYGTDGFFKVTGFTSTTVVSATVTSTLSGTGALTEWQEGAWSTYRGFPRTVTAYNQRLVFGGNTSQPDTFWASQVSDYFQMHDIPATAGVADPQRFTLASARLNQIRWMVGGKKLTIGTASSEWVGVFVEDGTTLRVQFDEETTHGSAKVQALKSDYAISFVQRSGQIIREIGFNFDADAYQATNLTLFANHIATAHDDYESESEVLGLSLQTSPAVIQWAYDSAGRLYGLTRDKQQQIAAWHSHILGGNSDDEEVVAVAAACVVPSTDTKKDRLWLVVSRYLNGTQHYFVEYLDDIKSHLTLTGDYTLNTVNIFLDCAYAQVGASATAWSGFTMFASTSPYCVAENASGVIVYNAEIDVNGSGQITLPVAATKVTLGYLQRGYLRLLQIEGGNNPEIPLASEKRADEVTLRLHQSWGLRIGPDRHLRKTGFEDNTDFEPIPFDYTAAPPWGTFTGTKQVSIPGSSGTDAGFALAMEEPWPCTILGLSSRVVFSEV